MKGIGSVPVMELGATNLPELQKLIDTATRQKEELDATLKQIGEFKVKFDVKSK